MVFSSPIFLFCFLPIVLALGFATRRFAQNAFLLVASLIFYAWGEAAWAWIILVSIAMNYAFGLWLGAARHERAVLVIAVVFNLGLLAGFKYLNFAVQNLNVLLGAFGASKIELQLIHLPIGISFFTFHALSYLVDVRRGVAKPQKNPIDFALYITMFPQLIAGPIIRYHDIADQLSNRQMRLGDFALGVHRFVVGLGKKVLIANTVARSVDAIFALPTGDLTASIAWSGALLYTVQIYFDFSAYSDMAIGLARMFGFRFLENFEYPYVSQSVTEFWRRWHISLSNWFRDYLYVPLGGNRRGTRRMYANLVTVFLLCGLWHGASFTFVAWGLYQGVFLILERTRVGLWLVKRPRPLRHAYLLLVVVVGWVLFRADTLEHAGRYLSALVGLGAGTGIVVNGSQFLELDVIIASAVAVLGSAPLVPWLVERRERLRQAGGRGEAAYALVRIVSFAALSGLFVASAAWLASSTYNPFIYFRF